MIHEVMVLDHGGPALGLILYGASVKLFLFAALLLGVAVPFGALDAWMTWPLFAAGLCAVAVAIGVLESVMARLRLLQIPTLLVAAGLMSGFGVVLLARS
jgi:formate hydrogenlyase subunit 4